MKLNIGKVVSELRSVGKTIVKFSNVEDDMKVIFDYYNNTLDEVPIALIDEIKEFDPISFFKCYLGMLLGDIKIEVEKIDNGLLKVQV